MQTNPKAILALDVGTVRIGLAIAMLDSRFARPLITLANSENFTEQLLKIIKDEAVGELIVGLPRGLDGQETAQTSYVRTFTATIESVTKIPCHFQDEALSSVRAKTELQTRGKDYSKAAVDALAATYILEDYLGEQQ